MSEAIPVNAIQLPDSLKLVLRDKIDLESVLKSVMNEDAATVIMGMAQNEIDLHMERVVQYFQEQYANVAIDNNESNAFLGDTNSWLIAKTDAEQFIKTTLDTAETPITIYDARSAKGDYKGEIVYNNGQVAVQRISAESVILHPLFAHDTPMNVGQSLQIRYQDGNGSVNDWMPSQKTSTKNLAATHNPQRYVALDIEFDENHDVVSGIEVKTPHAIGVYENKPDGTRDSINDYRLSAAKEVDAALNLLNAGEINLDDAMGLLNKHELTSEQLEKIIRDLNKTPVVASEPTPTPTHASAASEAVVRDPGAYEDAQNYILNLDAEAKISEPRLSKGNYKGSALTDINGYVVQQIGDHSFVIHDLTHMASAIHPIEFGVEQKMRFIYKDGVGSIEKVSLEVPIKNVESSAVTPVDNEHRYVTRPVRFGIDETISGQEVADPNALGLYENMADGTQNHIADYIVNTSAAKKLQVSLKLLNANEINIDTAMDQLKVYEITDDDHDKIIAELKNTVIHAPSKEAASYEFQIPTGPDPVAATPIDAPKNTAQLGTYEDARTYVLHLDAEAKISEPRLSKGNYKGSVLSVSGDYVVQQIGDQSYVIHDLANMASTNHAIDIGTEYKMRFIYKDGLGSIEKVDLEAATSKEAIGGVSRPSPALVTPAKPIISPLHEEAIKHSQELLGAEGKLYAARTTDNALSKGEFLFVNNEFAVQKIGKTTAVVHDRAAIDSSVNLKTIQGPVAITYQNGKAAVEALRPDYWKTNQKDMVNKAWSQQSGAQRPLPVQTPVTSGAEMER